MISSISLSDFSKIADIMRWSYEQAPGGFQTRNLPSTEKAYDTRISAYGTLLQSLQTLNNSLAGISTSSPNLNNAVVSDPAKLTAAAGPAASQGTFIFAVNSVAQPFTLKSKAYSSADSVVGTGSILIQTGNSDPGITVDITDSRKTLSGINDALNASGAAITSSIVKDQSGYRLLVTSNNSGQSNALNIVVTADGPDNTGANGLSALSYNTFGPKNMQQVQPSGDTTLFVNNSFYSSSSNTISNAVTGVTLNLQNADAPYPASVTVNQDVNGFILGNQTANGFISGNLTAFVKAYNSTLATIDTLQPDNQGLTGGTLSGDYTVANLRNQLTSIQNKTYGNATYGTATLNSLGFNYNVSNQTMSLGTLSLNIGALNSAVKTNPNQFAAALNALSSDLGATLNSYTSTILPNQQQNDRSMLNSYVAYEKNFYSAH